LPEGQGEKRNFLPMRELGPVENSGRVLPGILTVKLILMAVETAKQVYNKQFRGQ